MMGLEPTTFCMAKVGERSQPCADVAKELDSQPLLSAQRTRANPNERRTFAKQDQPEFEQAVRGSVVFRLATHGAATPRSAASAGTDTSAEPKQMTPKN
jgi:hypothetical protein